MAPSSTPCRGIRAPVLFCLLVLPMATTAVVAQPAPQTVGFASSAWDLGQDAGLWGAFEANPAGAWIGTSLSLHEDDTGRLVVSYHEGSDGGAWWHGMGADPAVASATLVEGPHWARGTQTAAFVVQDVPGGAVHVVNGPDEPTRTVTWTMDTDIAAQTLDRQTAGPAAWRFERGNVAKVLTLDGAAEVRIEGSDVAVVLPPGSALHLVDEPASAARLGLLQEAGHGDVRVAATTNGFAVLRAPGAYGSPQVQIVDIDVFHVVMPATPASGPRALRIASVAGPVSVAAASHVVVDLDDQVVAPVPASALVEHARGQAADAAWRNNTLLQGAAPAHVAIDLVLPPRNEALTLAVRQDTTPPTIETVDLQVASNSEARVQVAADEPVQVHLAWQEDEGLSGTQRSERWLRNHDVQLAELAPAGTYTLTLSVTDAAGHTTQHDPVTFTTGMAGGGPRPVIQVVSPRPDAEGLPAVLVVEAVVDPNRTAVAPADIRLLVDGQDVTEEATVLPEAVAAAGLLRVRYVRTDGWADGTHTAMVAVTHAGRTSTAEWAFTVGQADDKDSPAPGALVLIALVGLLAAVLRRPR